MNVAQTIMDQIKTLDRRAFMAWGAKEFVNMGQGLKFKSSGLVRWKGYVYVKYNAGTDLYDLDFFQIRDAEIKYTQRLSGIFAEDLVNIIDGVVG
jgi:hypothetical protein